MQKILIAWFSHVCKFAANQERVYWWPTRTMFSSAGNSTLCLQRIMAVNLYVAHGHFEILFLKTNVWDWATWKIKQNIALWLYIVCPPPDIYPAPNWHVSLPQLFICIYYFHCFVHFVLHCQSSECNNFTVPYNYVCNPVHVTIKTNLITAHLFCLPFKVTKKKQ